MSRSELYAKALAEYLDRHSYENLTEKINTAMLKINGGPELVGEVGISALRNLEW
jgi:hypothetical protein